jgi:hypothetical protein
LQTGATFVIVVFPTTPWCPDAAGVEIGTRVTAVTEAVPWIGKIVKPADARARETKRKADSAGAQLYNSDHISHSNAGRI